MEAEWKQSQLNGLIAELQKWFVVADTKTQTEMVEAMCQFLNINEEYWYTEPETED